MASVPTTMAHVSTKKVSKKQALRRDLGEAKYNKLKRTSKTMMSLWSCTRRIVSMRGACLTIKTTAMIKRILAFQTVMRRWTKRWS